MTIKKLLLLVALLVPACVAARTTITVKPGKNAIQNAINKAANINDDVVIELTRGTYRTHKTIELTSGKWNSLLITARKGDDVRITGDVAVPKKRVHAVTDKALLQRIPAEARSRVLMADCRGLVDSLSNIRPSGFGRKSMPAWSELMVDG